MPLNPASPIYGKTATGANEAIGCTTPTAATGVLTFSGQPANGETVTVGPFTYVWTNVTANVTGQTPYYVLIGTNTAASIVNLTAAINGTASKGTLFSNNTRPNPLATAVATSGTILTITATNPGADGDGFATLSGTANATWANATSTGAVNASLQVTGPGGSGIPVTPSSPVGTYTMFHVANSGSTTIPTTAKRWAVNFVGTGTTNTFGGNTTLTGNQSFSDNGAPASAIAIACDGSTVADGFYSTT